MEQRILLTADLVITSSKVVYDHKRPFCRSIVNVPNAVDFELYSGASDQDNSVPRELEGISRPIIGFSGTINHRFDFQLFVRAAKSFPNFSFVLISPNRLSLKPLDGLANVHYSF